MPRDANGNYTLPAGNPVISGTTITTTWANTTLPDIGNELTDSLSRSGDGGMLAPLRLPDGSAGVPTLSWTNEITSGWYRFGAGDFRYSLATVDIMSLTLANDIVFQQNDAFSALQECLRISAQLVGLPSWEGIEINALNITAGTNPIIPGVQAAMILGTDDPANEQHLAFGETTIQSKADGGTAGTLNLNTLGGTVNLGQTVQTVSAAAGGLRVDNQLTGTGPERVLTTSDLGGGGGDAWQLSWMPYDAALPDTDYATLDSRNNRPVLDFDDTTQETCYFEGVLPNSYSGGGVTITLLSALTSATTGTLGYLVAFERIEVGVTDLDSDSFGSTFVVTATTVPGTSGVTMLQTLNLSDGAAMDNLLAGERFRLRIQRNVSLDTAVGDAELVSVSMVEQ